MTMRVARTTSAWPGRMCCAWIRSTKTCSQHAARGMCDDVRSSVASTRQPCGGTVIGAIVGGALGNQVGKGDGRKAATVAGALIGGAIGNNAARRDDRYYSESETRCRVDQRTSARRRIVGYDVQYRYRGDVFMSHLDLRSG